MPRFASLFHLLAQPGGHLAYLGAPSAVAGTGSLRVGFAPAHAAPTSRELPDNCDQVTHDATTFVEWVVAGAGAITFDDLVDPDLPPRAAPPARAPARRAPSPARPPAPR